MIQLLDQQAESSARERIKQEEREALLMAENIYDKKFGTSTRAKEDAVKEVNLGTEADPQMVRISTQVEGQFLKDLIQLLKEYKDVFAWDYSQVKGIDASLHQHRINLKEDAIPIVQQRYRMNPNFAQQVKQEIDKLLSVGFIKPVNEVSWMSPIIVVPKKNGKIRVCVDYRKLNASTITDPFPMPFCDGVLDAVIGHEMYSFLDGFSRI